MAISLDKVDKFQSTPPCGGDLDAVTTPPEPVEFQSTPPCGGDFNFIPNCLQRPEFQSTPPCGGDFATRLGSADDAISIHAPLRGRL